MSELFKTTDLPYEILLQEYERIGNDYTKETAENAQLKADIKCFRSE